jgi:saccharopine dehydrogenase-like NADP-dependent oxidoreductase
MPEHNIVVLGGGLVGGFIARELSRSSLGGERLRVTLVDRDSAGLERSLAQAQSLGGRLSTNQADVSDRDVLLKVIEEATLIVGALPGHLGFAALRTVIESGRSVVDISFCPEDLLALDSLARNNGCTVVVDCGVMPGLGGMLAVNFAQRFRDEGGEPQSMRILVGGLPIVRRWPFEYTAPFSPSDVIEEYVRPARVLEHGKLVEYPALSGIEHIEFPGIGTLEAFNTDGLRSLLVTLNVPSMVEKTLRYPGHAEKMRLLRELGLFSPAPLRVAAPGGSRLDVAPLALAETLLRQAWSLPDGEGELTAMRVEVSGALPGESGAEALTLRADLLDYGDSESYASSMARTTGWPAIIAARMILDGTLVRPGVLAPELIGQQEPLWRRMLVELEAAGIEIRESRLESAAPPAQAAVL